MAPSTSSDILGTRFSSLNEAVTAEGFLVSAPNSTKTTYVFDKTCPRAFT